MRRRLTSLCWLLLAASAAAQDKPAAAQATALAAAPAVAASTPVQDLACKPGAELQIAPLLGQWTVIWTDANASEPRSARLVFSRNPEFAESLIGLLDMGQVRHELAGDIEHDLLTLEESADGKSISANWSLRDTRCGRELGGQQVRASDGKVREVVLRRPKQW